MGKKRKHSETGAAANENKEETAVERPKRTLLGFKDGSSTTTEQQQKERSIATFRNKEKVLVTCSRRISYRLLSVRCSCSFLAQRFAVYD